MPTLRPLTGNEREAVRLVDEGVDYAVIEDQTRLTRAQIAAAVDLAGLWKTAGTPGSTTPAATPTRTRRVPTADARPVLSLPTAPARDAATPRTEAPARPEDAPGSALQERPEDLVSTLTGLLHWAAQCGDPAVTGLARAITEDLKRLQTMRERNAAAAPLRAQIADLEAQLAAKRGELADLLYDADPPHRGHRGRHTGPLANPTRRRASPCATDVRKWARDNGIEVAARGALAQDVMDAYGAAHPAHHQADAQPAP